MSQHDEITKIEQLTPEQEAMFPPWVEKWTKIGLSTEPADFTKAFRAIRCLYKQSNLDSVPIAAVSSPIVGALAASLLAVIVPGLRKLFKAVDEQFDLGDWPKPNYDAREDLDSLAIKTFPTTVQKTLSNITDDWVACDDPNVLASVDMIANAVLEEEWLPRINKVSELKGFEVANRLNLKSALQFSQIYRDAMLKETLEWHAWYGGQFWCAFAAWATFFRDCLNVSVPQIEHEANLCESAGYIWPNEAFCLVCERPRRLTVVNDRLDDGDGPAMEYPDEWQLWFIGGVRMPDKKIVLAPETITLDQIEKEQNEEVKRTMINRWGGRDENGEMRPNIVGWTKYINESGAVKLDERRNEVENTMELLAKTKASNMVILISHCPSTGRNYALEVPATVKTCEEAQGSLQQGNTLTQGGKPFTIVGRS